MTCSVCKLEFNPINPFANIRSDQLLQDLVFKLVPGLEASMFDVRVSLRPNSQTKLIVFFSSKKNLSDEDLRANVFNSSREQKDAKCERRQDNEYETMDAMDDIDVVSLCLVHDESKYIIRCSSDVSVEHLKKHVADKYQLHNVLAAAKNDVT